MRQSVSPGNNGHKVSFIVCKQIRPNFSSDEKLMTRLIEHTYYF